MITVQAIINASLEKVWEYWTYPIHVVNWNFASDDWHCPKASNDLRIDGTFIYTMASKDGKMSFDFEGEYTFVSTFSTIEYIMADGRKVKITFEVGDNGVLVTESFDPENENSEELQREGWHAILTNFKTCVENTKR
jgi:uncharacterized protein YndB with AHSA1/START domain